MKPLAHFVAGCLRFAVFTAVLAFFIAGFTDHWTYDAWIAAVCITLQWEMHRPRWKRPAA